MERNSRLTRLRGRSRIFAVLGLGVLASGTLDLVFASVFWKIKADVTPVQILQSIAAGLLGDASYSRGAISAVLGLALHYTIIAGMVGAYYLVSARVRALRDRWQLFGAVYGLWLYAAMTYVIVPLSAAGSGSKNPLWVASSIFMHVIIGLLCAWFVRRSVNSRTRPQVVLPTFIQE